MVFEIKIFFNFLYFLYILLCIYLTPSLWSHPTHGNRDLKTNLKSIPPEDASIPVTAFLDNIGLNEHV